MLLNIINLTQGCSHYLANLSSPTWLLGYKYKWDKSRKGNTLLGGSGPRNPQMQNSDKSSWSTLHTRPEVPHSLFHVKLCLLHCPAQLTWDIRSTRTIASWAMSRWLLVSGAPWYNATQMIQCQKCKAMTETWFSKLQSFDVTSFLL